MTLITVSYNERPFAVVRAGRHPADAIAQARALIEARWHGAAFGEEALLGTRAATEPEAAGWRDRGEDYLLVGECASSAPPGIDRRLARSAATDRFQRPASGGAEVIRIEQRGGQPAAR